MFGVSYLEKQYESCSLKSALTSYGVYFFFTLLVYVIATSFEDNVKSNDRLATNFISVSYRFNSLVYLTFLICPGCG
mgnify:CR=1 FL=1